MLSPEICLYLLPSAPTLFIAGRAHGSTPRVTTVTPSSPIIDMLTIISRI